MNITEYWGEMQLCVGKWFPTPWEMEVEISVGFQLPAAIPVPAKAGNAGNAGTAFIPPLLFVMRSIKR